MERVLGAKLSVEMQINRIQALERLPASFDSPFWTQYRTSSFLCCGYCLGRVMDLSGTGT